MAVDKRTTRLGVLAMVSVLLIGALGSRIWFLQGTQAEEYQDRVTASKTRTVLVPPERGRIFDSEGRIIADNKRVLTVAVDWSVIRRRADRDMLFERLSGPLNVPVVELQRRYDPCYQAPAIPKCEKGNIYSTLLPLPLREDVSEEAVGFIMERSEDYPGITVVEEWKRVYPYAPLASHVVGYMGSITKETLDYYLGLGYNRNERVGQFGVELSMEAVLHGSQGKRVFEIDAAGNVVRELLDQYVPPQAGRDIQLTIDLELQQYAEQALETQLLARRTLPADADYGVEKQPQNIEVVNPFTLELEPMDPTQPLGPVPYKAPAGSVVVMNHSNGQVLAMASYPTFDNRWMNSGISSEKYQQLFPSVNPDGSKLDPDRSILVNRAVQGRYNLGSTMKPFIAWSALHSGVISADEVWVDEGTYTIQSIDKELCKEIRCVFRNANDAQGIVSQYGPVRVEESLAVSSDTFYYRIGELFFTTPGLRPELKSDLEQFGFGSDSGIQLPYEWDGRIPDDQIKADLLESGVLAEGEVPYLVTGDYLQVAIGQGLMAATPLQIANAYATIANQGFLMTPTVVKAILEPLTPDADEQGWADLTQSEVEESFDRPKIRGQLEMPNEVREPIVAGLTRVITGPGVYYPSNRYRSPTGEKLFSTYDWDKLPVAGKTGTAQGAASYPWNDSSAFAGFSLDDSQPYTVTAYLEKAGYGSRAAAPVVKCIFKALAGDVVFDPVLIAEPLDLTSTLPAPPKAMADPSCLNGVDITQRD